VVEHKKIIVYGSEGMLGYDLRKELSSDYDVIGFDLEDGDITDRENVLKTISHIYPDLVINCAAYTDVDGCETNVQKAYSVNADGCLFIAQACKEYNIKLIFISTDYIFNGRKKAEYSEEDEPDPLNIYGKSKLKGEKFLTRTNPNFICIRTSGLYGIKGDSFVKAILSKAKTESHLKVVNDQKCCPTYTKDLSNIIKKLFNTDYSGFINAVNTYGCSWFDFAKDILKLAGLDHVEVDPISSDELALPAKRPENSILSTRKLENELGIKARKRIEALADFLNELKESSGL